MASKKTWFLQNTEDPKLFGTGSMDIIYDAGGRLAELSGLEKLRFLALKCILTGRYIEEGASYGSTIPRLVGQKVRSGSELIDGLYAMAADRGLRSFKDNQPNDLDPSEEMTRIDGEILVARDNVDRTILLIRSAIRNANGDLIPVIHSFKLI